MSDKRFVPEFFVTGKCKKCSKWSKFEADQGALAYIGEHGYSCAKCLDLKVEKKAHDISP